MRERAFVNGGRFVSLFFYIIICVSIVIRGYQLTGLPAHAYLCGGLFVSTTLIVLIMASPAAYKEQILYVKVYSVFFVLASLIFSYAFGSISVLLFLFLVRNFLIVIYLNKGLYYFQTAVMMSIFLLIGIVAATTNVLDRAISNEHVIGMLCVFAVQWVCIHIVHLFNTQNRFMLEQEQSMDDLLHILEMKCYEARQATQSKSDFLSNMSHEIRTPINSVLGMNEMILRESRDENITEYASNINSSGRMLLSLINDVLDFSKIESGKMEIVQGTYLVSDFLNDLISMLYISAKEKGLGFILEIDNNLPRELFGDDVRLRQVFTNLLTNAIKYTEEGAVTLKIEGELLSEFKVILHCEVRDTGIGIREQDIPNLFAAFRRVEERRNRKILGTGLGLPITYHILEIMGSRLHVESEYGKGSVFYFDLEQDIVDETPIRDFQKQVRTHALVQNSRTSLYAPGARVLVVDDNEMNRKVFASLLKAPCIEVVQADSGMECLERMRETVFDIVFLDHMMPEMDGIETLHKLQEEGLCVMPVVALTANAVSGAREMYLSEGFDEFLSKPIMPEKLESLLFDMLPKDKLKEKPKDSESVEEKREEVKPDDGGGRKWEELPVISGIDWDFARIHFPNQELLLYTIEDFYNMMLYEADKLEELFLQVETDGDCGQYQIQVHGMKSSAALIGILPLAGLAKLLEDAARRQDREAVLKITPFFLREWRGFREPLGVLIQKPEQSEEQREDFDGLLGVLGLLQGAAEEMDIDTMDEMIKLLPQYRLPRQLEDQMEGMALAVTNLDTDEIVQITDKWICHIRKNKDEKEGTK